MMMTRCLVSSLAIAMLLWTTQARADDVNGAAKAFSQAQEAMLGGDVSRAADLYELADELAPSAPALRNATRARLAAGHLAMAATHAAALLRRYPSDKEAREMAEAILSKLAPQLAQLEVTCTAACTLLIDGKVVASKPSEQHTLFSPPGARTVTATFDDGRTSAHQVTALVDHTTAVKLEPPAKPIVKPSKAEPAATVAVVPEKPARRATARTGLSRWWVGGGAVVTAGFGTATIISGLSVLSTRDQIRSAVTAGQTTNAMNLYNSGRDAQTRTNIFLGATVAAAAGTAVLAVFTNWSGNQEHNLSLVPSRDGATLVFGHAF